MMKIFYEDNHLLVVEKKPNQPVQEDQSGDYDLLSELKDFIKVRDNKPGAVYLGLVHRLDRPVGGVMVFAKTSKAASRLSNQIRRQLIIKEYIAIVEGKAKTGLYEDYLYKDRKTNTSSVVKQSHKEAKLAKLRVISSEYNPKYNLAKVNIELISGRSHQIRVQMAARHHPLWGDARYNPASKPGQQIALWASSITLEHPISKKSMTFISPCPDDYPFTLW